MNVRRGIVLAVLAGVAAVLVAVTGGSAQEQSTTDKKLSLTVGTISDVDTFNPVVGVEVPDYEVWNLQYATLTDKAAKDFAPIPGLATSWKGSEDGRTWTYTLRPNLKWSDGRPLTAEDVVYTINRARKEEWLNYTATISNITASAPNPRTVVLRSSVDDPKLPVMDVYILPKHIWEKQSASAVTKYRALDGVGSGPFTLTRYERGQFWRMKANPNYWKGRPQLDEIVFRFFNNPDAMVAALQRGEADVIFDLPTAAFLRLKKDPNYEAVQGYQGSFDELALNGGDGLKKPHPALLDRQVRLAIAHAIDKKTIVDRVLNGLGEPADAISPSALPDWIPKIPDDQRFDFDLDKAKQILDQAGYRDTDGDGIREMPNGGRALRLRYAVRSESENGPQNAEFITGWLRQIGIATTRKVYSDAQLTEVIGKGDYDMFQWGWTPFVDPEPMLSYFTCDQVSQDPEEPTNYYNDANFCDPGYDALYKRQSVERDPNKRMDLVHQMLTRFYESAVYHPLYVYPDLEVYRKGRFDGWIRQPERTGPVIFNNSSQSYANLRPVSASASGGDDGGGLSTAGIVGIIVVAALLLGGIGFMLARRRTAYERE